MPAIIESCRVCREYFGPRPEDQHARELHEAKHVENAKAAGFMDPERKIRGMAGLWQKRRRRR